jgi:hypothetical protein
MGRRHPTRLATSAPGWSLSPRLDLVIVWCRFSLMTGTTPNCRSMVAWSGHSGSVRSAGLRSSTCALPMPFFAQLGFINLHQSHCPTAARRLQLVNGFGSARSDHFMPAFRYGALLTMMTSRPSRTSAANCSHQSPMALASAPAFVSGWSLLSPRYAGHFQH